MKSRRLIWMPFIAALVILSLWSGYWWFGANLMQQKAATQITKLQASGYNVQTKSIGISGWPYRFVLKVTELEISKPDSFNGVLLGAPIVLVHAMAWNPSHIIVELPDEASFFTNSAEEIRYKAARTRASFVFKQAKISRVSAEILEAIASNNSGEILYSTKQAEAHFRQGPTENSRSIFFFVYDPIWPQMPLKPISEIRLNGTVLSWNALQGNDKISSFRTDNGSVEIDQALLVSGQSLANFSGKLQIDENCYLSGKVKSRLVQPASLLANLDNQRLDADAIAAITALGLIIGGIEETNMSFRLKKGRVYSGPFRIAKAPRLPC